MYRQLVNEAFEKLKNAKTVSIVDSILDELQVEKKYWLDVNAYPPINFRIEKSEIDELRSQKLLNGKDAVLDVSAQNPLTRLLYALAWKNGDLKKIRHIVEGIESENDTIKDNALVFYQFGKYLSHQNGEPIIDQHVLRAFGVYQALKAEDQKEENRLLSLAVVTKKEKNLILDYKNFLRNELSQELRAIDNYAYHVDMVLFAVGKKIKIKKPTSVKKGNS